MNIRGTIVITNDDGYDAPGIHTAYRAVCRLGRAVVVAPRTERSACSHAITLRNPIHVERRVHDEFGPMFIVDGTPADCVRLAYAELIEAPIGLVISGINNGANAGVDVHYSGTVAGAREGAILRIPAVAVSQARRGGLDVDWPLAREAAASIVHDLVETSLPGPGFWNINFPAPIPDDWRSRIQHVPVATHAMPMQFVRKTLHDDREWEFSYGASYWEREEADPSDYTVLRAGGISISAVPLNGQFDLR